MTQPAYSFKSLNPVARKLLCHGRNPDLNLPYCEDDAEWEHEMLQQVAYFFQPTKKNTKDDQPWTRATVDVHWKVGALDFINEKCASLKNKKHPMFRTKHLFLEISLHMGRLLEKLVAMGVLEKTMVIVK